MKHGKNYRKLSEQIDKTVKHKPGDAVALALKTSPVKFDATLEAHIKLGVDPRQADQNIRANLVLPSGTGKKVSVAIFAPEDQTKDLKDADIVFDDPAYLDKNPLNFDILLTTPQNMPKLGKYARQLGPKGLMPSPKTGSVTADLKKALSEAKAGKIEYRVDKQGIVHAPLGKLSFGQEKLEANLTAFLDSLISQKPSSIKGVFIKSAYLTTTMGPSIPLETQ
jgi:large subunit ribosomal protein L1